MFLAVLLLLFQGDRLSESQNEVAAQRVRSHPKATIGVPLDLGNVVVTVNSVRYAEVIYTPQFSFSERQETTARKHYICDMSIRNVSEGMVFPSRAFGTLKDNFGNKAEDLEASNILGGERSKEIRPGHSRRVLIAALPKHNAATSYIWEISVLVSNHDDVWDEGAWKQFELEFAAISTAGR